MPQILDKQGKVFQSSRNLAGIRKAVGQYPVETIKLTKLPDGEGKLFIRFKDYGTGNRFNGATFEQKFASYSVMEDFVSRWRNVKGVGIERNPSQLGEAEEVFEDFHGFPPSGHQDFAERELYRDELAQLGSLEELEVLLPDSDKKAVPISFNHHTKLCVSPDRKQLYFVGGDQSLPIDELVDCGMITEEEAQKDLVTVGECFSITYDAKKVHLVGPKKSVPYIHQFGEEGGSLPVLIYDTLNKACRLAGGSYTVEDVGIKN